MLSAATLSAAVRQLPTTGPLGLLREALGEVLDGADPREVFGYGEAVQGLETRRERDRLIREIVVRFHPRASVNAAATAIAGSWRAYSRSARRLDMHSGDMPKAYAGRERELLWRIAQLPAEIPNDRQLRTIISRVSHNTMISNAESWQSDRFTLPTVPGECAFRRGDGHERDAEV
jgi:hypothetical protein